MIGYFILSIMNIIRCIYWLLNNVNEGLEIIYIYILIYMVI